MELYNKIINNYREYPEISEQIRRLHENPISNKPETYNLISNVMEKSPDSVEYVIGALHCSRNCKNYDHILNALDTITNTPELLKIVAKSFNHDE